MRLVAIFLPLLAMSSLSGAAHADLTVSFFEPEEYTDASLRHYGHGECGHVCEKIETHLQALARKHLDEGQNLTIDVRNIDLAGRFEPWRIFSHDVRFMREVTWPRIELHYELTENGRVLANGEERVSDMNYLMHVNTYFESDRLRYEKRMLDDWFRQRFGTAETVLKGETL